MAQEFDIYNSQYTAEQIEGFIASGKVRINPTNLHWELWDIATQAWTDTGIVSEGRTTGASWGDITGSLANQSDLSNALGNKSNNLMSSNRNLLDNSFFHVNQRGVTSETVGNTPKYFVDRWVIERSSYVVNADKSITLTITGVGYGIYQIIENGASLVGKQVTFSYMDGNNTIHPFTFVVPNTSGYVTFGNDLRIYVEIDNPNISVWLTGQIDIVGVPTILKALKLELGSISTLANDVAPDKETEKIKCMGSKADSSDTYANGCDMGGLRFTIVSTWS